MKQTKFTVGLLEITHEDGRKGHVLEINGNTSIPLSHSQASEVKSSLNLVLDPSETFEHNGRKTEVYL